MEFKFEPCKDYLNLIELSNKRKVDLMLQQYNYKKLSKKQVYRNYGYELHHIVPRYRVHDKKLSDVAENIALLTPREHILAHYYLSKFETGVYKYKAFHAFLCLCNFYNRKVAIEDIEVVISQLDDVEVLRKEYMDSLFKRDVVKQSAKRLSKIMTEKHKDSDFKQRVKNILHSKESLEKSRKTRMETMSKTPPWRVQKTMKQSWEFFDSIYEAVVKYKLSYKLIAKHLKVKYRDISNIVKIIKKKFLDGSSQSFCDFKFKDEFNSDFEPTLHRYEEYFKYEYTRLYVWKIFDKGGTSFLANIDELYPLFVNARDCGYNVSGLAVRNFFEKRCNYADKIISIMDEMYVSGIRQIKDADWYHSWLIHTRSFKKKDKSFLKRNGVYQRGNKYFVSSEIGSICSFKDLNCAYFIRDYLENCLYGSLRDVRHFTDDWKDSTIYLKAMLTTELGKEELYI